HRVVLCQLLAVAPDGDGLGRAPLGGQDDLLVGVALGVDDGGDALVVEVERAGSPERTVARPHALLAVDADLHCHGGPQPASSLNLRYRAATGSAHAGSGSTVWLVRAQRAPAAMSGSRPAATRAMNAAPSAAPSGTATTSTGRAVQSARACTHSDTRTPPPVATMRLASTPAISMC